MGKIRAYTKSKMDSILDDVIVDATIQSGDLVVDRESGATDNIGTVQGPQGPQGPEGDLSANDLTGLFNPVQPGAWNPLLTAITNDEKEDLFGFPMFDNVHEWATYNSKTPQYRKNRDVLELTGAISYTGATTLTAGSYIILTHFWPTDMFPAINCFVSSYGLRDGKFLVPIFFKYEPIYNVHAFGFHIPTAQSNFVTNNYIALDSISVPLT